MGTLNLFLYSAHGKNRGQLVSVITFTGSIIRRAMCWSKPREKTTAGMFGAQKNIQLQSVISAAGNMETRVDPVGAVVK
jgi:hypothetical protein